MGDQGEPEELGGLLAGTAPAQEGLELGGGGLAVGLVVMARWWSRGGLGCFRGVLNGVLGGVLKVF